MPLIKTENLTLSYENMTVIENLNFEVNSGDYLCIVGENGSGKSTLVKALLSLKKPVSGSITLGGGLKRNEIGYLPQQTDIQKDFPASVGEVVISGCLNRMGLKPFYSENDYKRADENMEKLGVLPLKKRSFKELSGGQRQRVLLARALCAASKLLLLDEPAAALDPIVTGEFYDIINRINKENITVIMVTHDIPAAVSFASHILCLTSNECFFGTRSEFLQSDISGFFRGGC